MNFNGIYTLMCLVLGLSLSSCKQEPKDEVHSGEEVSNSDSLNSIRGVPESGFTKSIRTKEMDVDITTRGNNDVKHLDLSINKSLADRSLSKAIQYDGIIQDAVTADLNSDGREEVYVFNQSAGSGSYGLLFAYQYNGKKLDSIAIDDLSEELSQKYLGHDSFAIDKKHLIRFFPLYNEMDPNCCPTGGKIRLKYDLVQKPNGLRLVLNSSINE